MNTNLELYRIFYTVACCNNISKAAELLYISQPAISKSIKKLENNIGIALFSRTSKGVKLTNDGKIFFKYIEKGLHEISMGEKILTKLSNKDYGNIKIGVSTTLCKHILIPNLKSFLSKYPNIQIKIINKSTFDTLKLIDMGDIDLGIVSCPFDVSSYEFIKLADIHEVFVGEKKYLESLNLLEANDIFFNSNFILLEVGNITRKYIDQYFSKNNILIKPEIEVSTMDFLIEFARIGLGVTVVIKKFVEKYIEEGSLIQIPIIPTIPKRSLGIIFHKKESLSIAAQTFVSHMQSQMNKY